MKDVEQEKIVPDVDYDKSIRKRRLVYKKTIGYIILDYIMMRGLIIFMSAMILLVGCQEWWPQGNYAAVILACFPAIWVTVSLFYLNTLVEVKGLGIVRNKEDVMNTLEFFYEDVTFDASKENMIRDVKPTGWWPGRVVTVLLAGDSVYFNKTALAKGSSVSPISGWTDYLKAKEMAAYFVRLQTKVGI